MNTLTNWTVALSVGLLISLVFGHFAPMALHAYLYKKYNLRGPRESAKRIPGGFTGLVERIFFTLVVFLTARYARASLPSLVTPALVWIGLKMSIHWQPSMSGEFWAPEDKDAGMPAAVALVAILCGLVSLSMAAVGGGVAAAIVGHE